MVDLQGIKASLPLEDQVAIDQVSTRVEQFAQGSPTLF